MMRTGALLDAVGNTHSILVFAQTTARMEIKSCEIQSTCEQVLLVEGYWCQLFFPC